MSKSFIVIIGCFLVGSGTTGRSAPAPDTMATEGQPPFDNTVRDSQTQPNQALRSDTEGDGAWRRIVNERHEWEGDMNAKAAWTFENYGGFLTQYPRHPHAGDALFKVAEATWARGGYPELFNYIMTPGNWDDWKAKAQYLEQWFDTAGFGGGIGAVVGPQDSKQAAQARELFLDVLTKYPYSQSAPMAAYYSAVILDYCLNDQRAVVEYEAFVRKYSSLTRFVEKANRRITTLRGRR